jgi:DNA invertase Pin-like site-specific DNA recombinase
LIIKRFLRTPSRVARRSLMAAKAYSYLRLSSDVQIRGDGLRRQLQASREYAAVNGLDLVEKDQLRDLGVSAFRGLNATDGALAGFLAAVSDKRVEPGSYLLIESLDRLSRQVVM